MQHNSKLYRDIDETDDYIINKYSKLTQKDHKNRHNWMRRVI